MNARGVILRWRPQELRMSWCRRTIQHAGRGAAGPCRDIPSARQYHTFLRLYRAFNMRPPRCRVRDLRRPCGRAPTLSPRRLHEHVRGDSVLGPGKAAGKNPIARHLPFRARPSVPPAGASLVLGVNAHKFSQGAGAPPHRGFSSIGVEGAATVPRTFAAPPTGPRKPEKYPVVAIELTAQATWISRPESASASFHRRAMVPPRGDDSEWRALRAADQSEPGAGLLT